MGVVVGLMVGLGLYVHFEEKLRSLELRLRGTEAALQTLEPLRSMMASGQPGGPRIEDPYAPEQAIGAPDVAEPGRDSARAWCPAREDAGEEWLLLSYGEEVPVATVEVHANFNPGAVVRVTSVGEDGTEGELWSGTPAKEGEFVQVLTLEKPASLRRLKLYFDTATVAGWNEVDAVGVVTASGKRSWAVGAEASGFWMRGQSGGREAVPEDGG